MTLAEIFQLLNSVLIGLIERFIGLIELDNYVGISLQPISAL